MSVLTKRQQEVLRLIRNYMRSHKKSPTLRELASLLGDINVSAVSKHLDVLEKKRYISREHGISRNITILNPDRCPFCGAER